MKINVGRFLKSGLLAGLVIIIVGFGLVPIIGDQMNEVLKRYSLPPLSVTDMIFFVFVSIANGMALAGLYILVEPYCKSKMRAVMIASIGIWFISYFLSSASLVAYGFMPVQLTVFGTAWGILEVVLAGIVVSKIYHRNK